jgi:TonB-dependent starch-binding outer membrane protein SusC
VSFEATVFRKRVSDLILSIPVASTSGFTTKNVNAGALQNTGTELGLNITPIQTSRITWISRTTYANVDGRFTSLRDPQTGLVQCGNFGSYFSTSYGAPYVCEGYSPSSVQARNGFDSLFTCGPRGTCNTGTYVNRTRRLTVFESAPDFNMGFSNEFTMGPIRLYGLLEWRHGGKVANLTNAYYDLATAEDIPTGMRADTAATIARNKNFLINGGSYLEDAGFVKLREISVGYTLPAGVTQGLFSSTVQDVRLEVSGRNLKTWTKYTGYDPEVSNFSNQTIGRFQDVTPYPPSRSVFLSLSANF